MAKLYSIDTLSYLSVSGTGLTLASETVHRQAFMIDEL